MKKALLCSLLLLPVIATSACEKGLAHGDYNAVIVVVPEAWWPELEDSVFSALSPDVFTMRDERVFSLAYQDPAAEEWALSRKFREEVVIGGVDDYWVTAILEELDDTVSVTVPGIVEAENVWAQNQRVTAILVDPTLGHTFAGLPLDRQSPRNPGCAIQGGSPIPDVREWAEFGPGRHPSANSRLQHDAARGVQVGFGGFSFTYSETTIRGPPT